MPGSGAEARRCRAAPPSRTHPTSHSCVGVGTGIFFDESSPALAAAVPRRVPADPARRGTVMTMGSCAVGPAPGPPDMYPSPGTGQLQGTAAAAAMGRDRTGWDRTATLQVGAAAVAKCFGSWAGGTAGLCQGTLLLAPLAHCVPPALSPHVALCQVGWKRMWALRAGGSCQGPVTARMDSAPR